MSDEADLTPVPGEKAGDRTELLPGGPVSDSSSTAIDGGRFAPGTLLDARYRIVALLGRGGMGEVYRAEDLKLGETVALKFLPESLASDGVALARFHREVRTARGIAHPSVVRVYDIGEHAGQPFLSMEFVAGEDLSVLLKRIGRLPGDKAIELARQICAGLAAAHTAGVLHRDLKPANVMIDAEGRAKISDFGLADLAADLVDREASGTPAYMAPEQLSEGRSSFASDLYALGLVLYEMFTGERAFAAGSRGELARLQQESAPTSPSSRVEGLDPLVEKVILRCLERDPADRPASAVEVSASLPGGDPLAVALAAGETPSPEMVARAEVEGRLTRRVGLALLSLVLVGTVGVLQLVHRDSILKVDGLPLRPEVLEHRARELLGRAGLDERMPAVGFFAASRDYVDSLHLTERTRAEWSRLGGERPPFVEFVVKAHPNGVAPTLRWRTQIWHDDPAETTPGLATVVLDSRGRLQRLIVGPGDYGMPAADLRPDWQEWFEASELDRARWTPIEPVSAPPVYADTVVAWRGAYEGQESSQVRIEAAARGERVVLWRLVDEHRRPEAEQLEAARASNMRVAVVLFALVLLVCTWHAVRSFRSGRGDRRGALRLGLVAGVFTLIAEGCQLALYATSPSIDLLLFVVAEAAFVALAVWALYMFLEPVMRRHFPRGLVSWTRLVSGRFDDPLVGRDLLLGWSVVVVASLLFRGFRGWQFASGQAAPLLDHYPNGLAALEGPLAVFGDRFSVVQIVLPLAFTFLFVAPRAAIRNPAVATAIGVLLLGGFGFLFTGGGIEGAFWAVILVVTARIGFVAVLALTIFMSTVVLTPVSLDTSQWWAVHSWIGLALVGALAVWAYRAAVRPNGTALR